MIQWIIDNMKGIPDQVDIPAEVYRNAKDWELDVIHMNFPGMKINVV